MAWEFGFVSEKANRNRIEQSENSAPYSKRQIITVSNTKKFGSIFQKANYNRIKHKKVRLHIQKVK